MKIAPVNGNEIAYETAGNGPALLLLHCGFIAGSGHPLLQQPALTNHYELIHYHRRGYGASAAVTSPCDIAAQADDAIALLDYLGIEQAHLAGHSFGGVIALEVVRRAPQRIPNVQSLEIPSGSHLMQIEKPQTVAQGLAEFCLHQRQPI